MGASGRIILWSHFPICPVVTWRCDRVRIEWGGRYRGEEGGNHTHSSQAGIFSSFLTQILQRYLKKKFFQFVTISGSVKQTVARQTDKFIRCSIHWGHTFLHFPFLKELRHEMDFNLVDMHGLGLKMGRSRFLNFSDSPIAENFFFLRYNSKPIPPDYVSSLNLFVILSFLLVSAEGL